MPSVTLKSLRFQKFDKFGHPVFIASENEENYTTLKDYAEKLQDKDYGTFLPIFHSQEHQYATKRFKKNDKYNPKPRAKYDVDFKIKIITKDSKIYVNCFIERMKFVEKAPVEDQGEELEL